MNLPKRGEPRGGARPTPIDGAAPCPSGPEISPVFLRRLRGRDFSAVVAGPEDGFGRPRGIPPGCCNGCNGCCNGRRGCSAPPREPGPGEPEPAGPRLFMRVPKRPNNRRRQEGAFRGARRRLSGARSWGEKEGKPAPAAGAKPGATAAATAATAAATAATAVATVAVAATAPAAGAKPGRGSRRCPRPGFKERHPP